MILIPPPITSFTEIIPTLHRQGYAILNRASVLDWMCVSESDLSDLQSSWDDLPLDNYLKDGGRYRRRRHSCFVARDGQLSQTEHRAHCQALTYNALHGGMQRWFEPIAPEVVAQKGWRGLINALVDQCNTLKGVQPWFIEAHQFRIDTTDGIGRPTPEGAHRDGVDFVAVLMIGRNAIKGGETRVFEAEGPNGQRFCLSEPWSMLFLDDERVIHESTPIQPIDKVGHRDTLVLTFRRGGFQGE
jgi:hypothetical protein